MAARKKLQVVDDKPKRPTRRDCKIERLEAHYARLAVAFDDKSTPARDLAPISRQMLKIADDIEELRAAEADSLDGAVSEDAEWEAI